MANEIEVRADGVAGAITDSPLTSTATTFNSAGLADLPAIGTTQFAKVTLFARDSNGRVTAREVVYVTAHTASATSATIVRGQEGTTGVSWASGSTWVHGATAKDATDARQSRGARASLTAPDMSIASSTFTVVPLTTEAYDSDNLHDTSTNPSRITVPAGLAGKWFLIAAVSYGSNATGLRYCRIRQNGSDVAVTTMPGTSPSGPAFEASTVVQAAAGDYFELFVYQDSGSSLTLYSGVGNTWLAAQFLGF